MLNKFIGLFKAPPKPPPVVSESDSVFMQSMFAPNGIHEIELVQLVLRKLKAKQKLAPDRITCPGILVTEGGEPSARVIHLVLTNWDTSLIGVLPTLERMVIRGLDLFDPINDHSNYSVVWAFSSVKGSAVAIKPESKAPAPIAPPVPTVPTVPTVDRGIDLEHELKVGNVVPLRRA